MIISCWLVIYAQYSVAYCFLNFYILTSEIYQIHYPWKKKSKRNGFILWMCVCVCMLRSFTEKVRLWNLEVLIDAQLQYRPWDSTIHAIHFYAVCLSQNSYKLLLQEISQQLYLKMNSDLCYVYQYTPSWFIYTIFVSYLTSSFK